MYQCFNRTNDQIQIHTPLVEVLTAQVTQHPCLWTMTGNWRNQKEPTHGWGEFGYPYKSTAGVHIQNNY